MFLVNSRLGLVSATLSAPKVNLFTPQVPLIPKLRGYFAEFLHHDSLDRLGILYLSTCVGFGYGRLTTRSRRFSRQHRITHFRSQRLPRRHVSGTRGADLPTPRPTHLARDNHRPGWATFLRPSAAYLIQARVEDSVELGPKSSLNLAFLASLASAGSLFRRYGNINPLSIDYACRPRLRSRLTQGRLA